MVGQEAGKRGKSLHPHSPIARFHDFHMPEPIVIVDYNAGNLRSVQRACSEVGLSSILSQDPDVVANAERLIFPGVGAAGSGVATLNSTGLGEATKSVVSRGNPVLGICLGAQIILDRSDEGSTACLGLIPGVARKFVRSDPAMKIPHMGWNTVEVAKAHPLLDGLVTGDAFYFVHSYFPSPDDDRFVFARSSYGTPFCCALGFGNLFATQFHPEKSGRLGLRLLERFAKWDGNAPA